MTRPKHFKPADLGGEVSDVQDAAGRSLFHCAEITWSEPKLWPANQPAPVTGVESTTGHLYVLVREHHRAKNTHNIVYVGITENLKTRFFNHPKANEIVRMRGQTLLSLGTVDYGGYRTPRRTARPALEEIEHILIWTLWHTLQNEKKMYTLPGMGSSAGRAWHITNKGYRFAGRMPLEIVFPWMLIRHGRDRTAKI